MEIFASGTLGDSFIVLLKHFNIRDLTINHFSIHQQLYPAIREIYSLKDDLKVNFIESLTVDNCCIHLENYLNMKTKYSGACSHGEVGHLASRSQPSRILLDSNEKVETPFPKFDLLDIEGLPNSFSTIQLQAGSYDRVRRNLNYDRLLAELDKNETFVLIGTDQLPLNELVDYNIIDLRNKTTLKESMSIISNGNNSYCPAGFISFFSMSQKIKTTIFMEDNVRVACSYSMDKIPEWDEWKIIR